MSPVGGMQKPEGRVMLDVNAPLVKVKNLKMHFPIYRGILSRRAGEVKAVDGVSLKIKKGETSKNS